MIKKILFGADLGPFTPHMLLHLESLTERFGAKIHVVHAVAPLGELASAVVRSRCSDSVKAEILATTHITGLLDTIKEEVFETFANCCDGSLVDRICDVVVAPGGAANLILFEAEKSGADLIVVGSHGTESIDGRILGSVATKVLQLSKIPVMLVPMMDPANMIGTTAYPLPRRA